MSAGLVGVVAGGMLVLAGLLVALAAATGFAPPQPMGPRRQGAGRVRFTRRHAVAAAAALAGFLWSGWVAVGLGAGGAVLALPTIFTAGASAAARVERRTAVASWTRRMADLLASGAVSSLDEALRRSAGSSPAVLRPHLEVLVTRMGPQGTGAALHAFGREFADEVADQVVLALSIRARHGGAGLAAVLKALAADVDAQVAMERSLQAETGRQVANVRWIVSFMLVMLVAALLFARDFLSPYSTPEGQVALGCILTIFAGALVWIRRLCQPLPGVRLIGQHQPVQGSRA